MIVSLSFRHAHEDEQCGQLRKWGRVFILQAMKLKTRFYISKLVGPGGQTSIVHVFGACVCTCELRVIAKDGELASGCKHGVQASNSSSNSSFEFGFEYQCQRNLAAFGHQDIVGAAGGLIIHAFDAYASRGQGRRQARVYETLAWAGAEYDDIRRDCIDLFKMLGRQGVEGAHRPRSRADFGQDYQAIVVRDQVDFNPVFIVRGNSLILLGKGAVQLHDGMGRNVNRDRGGVFPIVRR